MVTHHGGPIGGAELRQEERLDRLHFDSSREGFSAQLADTHSTLSTFSEVADFRQNHVSSGHLKRPLFRRRKLGSSGGGGAVRDLRVAHGGAAGPVPNEQV
jgi:hypothetical protein